MITLKGTYENRKDEIEKFIGLMKFLEKKKLYIEEDDDKEISFDDFFYEGELKIDLKYQELINILKSNVSLMLYNIIEFTVTGLLECIYDEIKMQNLSYEDVTESIRENWRRAILKGTRDPQANYNTFLKKNEEIIDYILSKRTLDMRIKEILPTGNFDGSSIKDTFKSHGIRISTNSQNFRPDILKNIKDNRNSLAHGSVSFVDAVRDDSIGDIENNANFITSFLRELIDAVEEYIHNEQYKISS